MHSRGRETVPVISLEGAMGVLLYGILAGWWWLRRVGAASACGNMRLRIFAMFDTSCAAVWGVGGGMEMKCGSGDGAVGWKTRLPRSRARPSHAATPTSGI
jgi:hypothetical protein